MHQSFIVEVGGEAVGLVSRNTLNRPFHFFASDARLFALDGASFGSARAAEAAARKQLQSRTDRASAQLGSSLNSGRYQA